MKLHWQAITTSLAGLLLLITGGWVMSLTHKDLDVAALKQDLLKTVEQRNQAARTLWIEQVRAEIERSNQALTQQQKADLKAALVRMDSRIAGRMSAAEDRSRQDAQALASGIYKTVAQQRAQDLKLINLRFSSIETRNAIENRQTDEILGTLLQAAEFRAK
jgi:competence protein ComGF